MVRDTCVAEWTIENGTAARYRLEGSDCHEAATQLAAH